MIPLHLGSTSADVATLQRRLNARGAHLVVDHIYGATTAAAVRTWQQANGLVADGVAGPRTLARLATGIVDPRHLTEADLQAAASTLQCDVAALHAVIQVETGNAGWLPDGRVAILFERHIMYRQLKAARQDVELLVARYPAVVNATPGGYRGGAGEYARLALAKQIDVACALSSASWGRFQLMGFHWDTLGFASVAAFVAAMQSGEAAQLQAFVTFVQADTAMHEALKAHDWPTFAERYNGPAQAKDHYAGRLQRAYARHAANLPEPAPSPVSPPSVSRPAKARKTRTQPAAAAA